MVVTDGILTEVSKSNVILSSHQIMDIYGVMQMPISLTQRLFNTQGIFEAFQYMRVAQLIQWKRVIRTSSGL